MGKLMKILGQVFLLWCKLDSLISFPCLHMSIPNVTTVQGDANLFTVHIITLSISFPVNHIAGTFHPNGRFFPTLITYWYTFQGCINSEWNSEHNAINVNIIMWNLHWHIAAMCNRHFLNETTGLTDLISFSWHVNTKCHDEWYKEIPTYLQFTSSLCLNFSTLDLLL